MKNTQIVEVLKYLLNGYDLLPVPKLFRDKPASSKLTYTLDHSQRGRVPAWVLKQGKAKTKAALRAKFKDGHKFVKG